MRLLLAVTLLALAGCASPGPAPVPSQAPPAPVPDADYPLTVLVRQETADGAAVVGAEVQAFVLDAAGKPGAAIPRSTDALGAARFSFEAPVRIAVRSTAPGWTVEGFVLDVGEQVIPVGRPAVVSERDLFLPLYHADVSLAAATSLVTDAVRPTANGSVEPPLATAELAFPEGLADAYLSRLVGADVRVRWEDTVSSRAHLAAGLAWDGALWVRGEAGAPGLVPGPREATFSGAIPMEERPAAPAGLRLQAAAVLESAAVGDVPLAFEVHLAFAGSQPPGLPKACHSALVCLPGLPVARSA